MPDVTSGIGKRRAHRAFAVGGPQGGAFNPAVVAGAATMGLFAWEKIWVLLLPEPIAGALGAQPRRAPQPRGRRVT